MDAIPLNELVRCAIHVAGRIAIPPEQVRRVVATNRRVVKAFNLCDGSPTQARIRAAAGLDQGNFSRTVARRIANGVLFRIGSGNDARLLHIYALPPNDLSALGKRKPSRRSRR